MQRVRHQLKSGDEYGKLTIRGYKPVVRHGVVHYSCKCRCGGTLTVTLAELHRRDQLGLGCLAVACHADSPESKAWHDPVMFTARQLRWLANNRPQLVSDSWSDHSDAMAVLSVKASAMSTLPILTRATDKLPLAYGNAELVTLASLPDSVFISDVPMQVTEVADMYGTVPEFVAFLSQYTTGSQLIDAIIQETLS